MDKISKPIVSIVMATFNRSVLIVNTVNNIFRQTYSDFELIIINDGSSDDTYATLLNLQNKFDFVLINNPKNLGLQKSLNLGIKKAKGKYIARIDDHDIWLNNEKLYKQISFLESNPNVGLIGTGYRVGEKNMINPLTDAAIRKQILMRSPFCHVSVLMLKSIFDKVGGYNEALPYSEDWDLWLKFGKHTQFANLPDIMVGIQEEEEISLSGDYFLKQLPLNRQIVKQYYKDYPQNIKAFFYHQFLRFFFATFPLNGKLHQIMKHVFQKSFALTSKGNASNGATYK